MHHSKTPGWSEPYSRHRAYRPALPPEDSVKRTGKERLVAFLLDNHWVPLGLRVANFTLTVGTLGVAIRIRKVEGANDVLGVSGSSALVAIIYSPIVMLQVLVAVWFEYFGKPIGLWHLPHKLLFTSVDLFAISLWASLASLSFSDLLSTPLRCLPISARWWTTLPPLEGDAALDFLQTNEVCHLQGAMAGLILVGLVGLCLSNVVGLSRLFKKVVVVGRGSA